MHDGNTAEGCTVCILRVSPFTMSNRYTRELPHPCMQVGGDNWVHQGGQVFEPSARAWRGRAFGGAGNTADSTHHYPSSMIDKNHPLLRDKKAY